MADPYTTLTTMLIAAWEGGVITQPTFFNLKVQSYRPPNSIGIEFLNAPVLKANAGVAERHRLWNCIIYVFALSDANRELIIEQLMKHMLAYDNASIKYNIEAVQRFEQRFGLWECEVIALEDNFITTSAW